MPVDERTAVRAVPPLPACVLAVGGSAGSIGPLRRLLASLDSYLDAVVVVTVHIGLRPSDRLTQVLARSSSWPVAEAREGERLERGRVLLAPSGRHLLVADGATILSSGPRVNRHRPSVDVMLAGAARWAGARTVAVVLSGALDDGAVGSALVHRAGGQVLVQDPKTAEFAGMPRAALGAVPEAGRLTPSDAGPALAEAVAEAVRRHGSDPAAEPARPREGADVDQPGTGEPEMAQDDDIGYLSDDESRLTRLTCPECGGGIAEVRLDRVTYFRCHTGHQYSPQTFAAAQAEAAEAKLWAAVAAMEEHAAFQHWLARHAAPRAAALEVDEAELNRAATHAGVQAAALRSRAESWAAGASRGPRDA